MVRTKLQGYKIDSQKKNKKDFSHVDFVFKPNLSQYLCSLNVEQFNTILGCVLLYIDWIPYPDCEGGVGHRRLG